MKSVDVHPEGGGERVRPNVAEGPGACGPIASYPGGSAMPVTVRYSAALDRTYEEADSSLILAPSVSPTPTDSSRASGCSTPSRTDVTTASSSATHDGDFGFPNRTNSVDSLDGGSSVGSGGHSRQISSDSTEFIPTRTIKTNAKPAFNPLQFVKTSRSVLVEKAEQQIRQFEEVKKVKERVREDEEAWQSNLDNWKSKRRQISSRTNTKTESTESQEKEKPKDWQRKKSKTFSEMMEERSKRGTANKLPLYNDWSNEESFDSSGHDTASKTVDGSFESSESDHAFEDYPVQKESMPSVRSVTNGTNGTMASTLNTAASVAAVEDNAPQEYTFEKAIQSYTQYAESRTRTHRPTSVSPQLSDSNHMASSIPSGKTNGDWDVSEHSSQQQQHDSYKRSMVQTDVIQRTESNGRSNGSPYNAKTSTPDLLVSPEILKLDRAEGEELMIVVSLRRGAENKDFGFAIKSVRGVGTGIFVESVHHQSPAESAGLKVDDEILAINGEYCNSKRTHSAIVFAIKQAVYTGRLELNIYRYHNTDFLHIREPLIASTPVSAMESGQQLYRTSAKVRAGASPGSRESSPVKVDIVKRRSLFELSASPRQSPEKIVNRRSLDVSVNFKDKLASFQNLESSVDNLRHERQKSTDQGMSFKEKLASFESLDSFDRSAPVTQSLWTADAGRQKSLENVSRVHNDNRQREDAAQYQTYQAFERTRSCEVLDFDCPSSADGRQEVTDWQSAKRSNSGLFHAIPDSESPNCLIVAGQEVNIENEFDFKLTSPTSTVEVDVIKSAATLDDKPSFNDASLHHVSGFELAASLEETAITGSVPSSPLDSKIAPVLLEPIISDQQPDRLVLPVGAGHSFVDTPILPFREDIDSEVVVVDNMEAPTKQLEPPKEKPPPPPIEPDVSDSVAVDHAAKDEFRRVNSTKRIQKEIWKRRSDFLGIDPDDVQNFIENEISQVSPPPNVGNLLREELNDRYDSRQELLRQEQERSQLLAKAEFAETGIAVGNAIELDKQEVEKNDGIDEEEMARKEREIIENLEWEELHQKQDDRSPLHTPSQNLSSEQQGRFLPHHEVMDETQPKIQVPNRPVEEDWKLKQREVELQRQEELLKMEKEKLRREQEELLRQKQEYQRQISHHQQRSISMPGPVLDLGVTSSVPANVPCNGNLLGSPIYEFVQPDLLADGRPRTGLPPPPPSKPKLNSSMSLESETNRPPAIRPNRHSEIVSPVTSGALQPLTKQTLYALSASPKAKLVEGDQWMATRRKTDSSKHDNHNQHWLVQEAEFRRLHPQHNGVQRSEERPTVPAPCSPTRPDWSPQSPSVQWNGARQPHTPLTRSVDQQRLSTSHNPSRTPSVPTDRWHHDIDPKSPSLQPQSKPGLCPKPTADRDTQMLSVSGKKKCSHCGEELGRGAAMIIESLQLFYHINCFKCCVCHVQLGNGSSGADVRVRSQKLHCHNCYSNDEGLKFSKV